MPQWSVKSRVQKLWRKKVKKLTQTPKRRKLALPTFRYVILGLVGYLIVLQCFWGWPSVLPCATISTRAFQKLLLRNYVDGVKAANFSCCNDYFPVITEQHRIGASWSAGIRLISQISRRSSQDQLKISWRKKS